MAEGFDDLTMQERAEGAAKAWEEFWAKIELLGGSAGFCTVEILSEDGQGFAPMFGSGDAAKVHWIASLGVQRVLLQAMQPPAPPKQSPIVLAPAQAGLKVVN